LYLLLPGQPSSDARANRNGAVQVVSLDKRAIVSMLDAGRAPRGLVPDRLGILVASDGPPGRLDGELRAIRGDALAFTRQVAGDPRLVAVQRDRIFVVGAGAVAIADPASGEIAGTVALVRDAERLVFDDDVPRDVQVSSDGRRAFVWFEPGSKLAVVDLEQPKLLGVAKTGRGSKKLLRGLGHVASAVLVPSWEWASVANSAGMRTRDWPGRQLALRPDGRFAYALNTGTQDVTVIDASSARAVAAIPAGGLRLESLGGGAALAVLSVDQLHLLETSTDRKLAQLELPGLRDVVASADGRHALAIADFTVVCLDGSSGAVIATIKQFVTPTIVLFEAAPPES
jgi:hypothetical protein